MYRNNIGCPIGVALERLKKTYLSWISQNAEIDGILGKEILNIQQISSASALEPATNKC